MVDWVLIADDHPLMRDGLRLAAQAALPDCAVVTVGTVNGGAIEIARRDYCRLILLDFHLPDSRGYSGFLQLQDLAPKTPIVIVSARQDRSLVDAAEALDAAGYIFKTLALDEIANVLRRILVGERYFPPAIP